MGALDPRLERRARPNLNSGVASMNRVRLELPLTQFG